MKKILLFSVIAGMALTGCVKNEVYVSDTEETGPKIAFESPFLYGNKTKANVLGELNDAAYPTGEEFIIFAAQHESAFASWPNGDNLEPSSTEDGLCGFNGKKISYYSNFDAWVPTYDKKNSDGTSEKEYYYWPQGKKLSFSAMSPAEGVTNYSYNDNGLTITDFTNPDVGNQFDLMFARRITNQTAADMSDNASTYSGIPISFQHALASLHFSIDQETTDQNVKLISVTLNNVKHVGSFKEGITSNSAEYIIDQTSGNTVNPQWTVTDAKTNYTTFDAKISGDNLSTAIPFPVNPRYITDVLDDLKKGTGGEVYNDVVSSPLLVLPQQIDDDVTLEIKYAVNDQPMDPKVVSLRGLATLKEGGITNSVTEDSVVEWKRGHKYSYRIHYSSASEMKDIIYFSPSVEGWTDVQVIEITL